MAPPHVSSPSHGHNLASTGELTGAYQQANSTSNDGHITASESLAMCERMNPNQLWERYNVLKGVDTEKNRLFEDLMIGFKVLEQQHNNLIRDMERLHSLVSMASTREKQLESDIGKLSGLLNRDGFLLVIIDGHDLIFHEHYLRAGKEGGKRVAEALDTNILNWAATNIYECPRDVKLVVRIFADVQRLSNACYRSAIVKHPSVVQDFVHGFNVYDDLFDFVDVGPGNDTNHARILACFRLHLYDYQCRQIFLGGDRDRYYTRLSRSYAADQEVLPRVTFIDGRQSEDLAELLFPKVQLQAVFHQSSVNLDIHVNVPSGISSSGLVVRTDKIRTNGGFTPGPLKETSVASSETKRRTDSVTSSTTSSDTASGATTHKGKWNKVASKAASLPFKDLTRPTPTPKPAGACIMRNKQDQRVDPPMEYDHDRVAELKKLKYCNQHYIGKGCCHWQAQNGACPHRHDVELSKENLKWLRVVARETVCKRGTGCEELDCIYGHHCPYPQKEDGTGCVNGACCRFAPEMHGMDTKVVKYLTAASLGH